MDRNSWSHRDVLITGGTGSFGKAFVRRVLQDHPEVNRLIVYSRDELKQYEMQQEYPREQYPNIRFFIGDVRDLPRMQVAMEGVTDVIHAAAMKQVPTSEYNPFECIKTNVMGAQNVISAAIANNVQRVVALSTDKACAPINLYGATKLCSDKMFVAANHIHGSREMSLAVVRYGNVMGSRGSVIPFFLKQKPSGVLTITDSRMTRFNILLSDSVSLVLDALDNSLGGEIYVPKIPSYRILDVAEAVAPECEHRVVGIRPGEKLHEEMITAVDSLATIETDEHYVIVPQDPFSSLDDSMARYQDFHDAQFVSQGFSYASNTNDRWLSVNQLREMIHCEFDSVATSISAP
jgi:UDP-N-acetylglucosamine 4,6-dehydratase